MTTCEDVDTLEVGATVFVLEGFHKYGTVVDREDDAETGWSFYTVRLRTGEVINELTYPETIWLEGEMYGAR